MHQQLRDLWQTQWTPSQGSSWGSVHRAKQRSWEFLHRNVKKAAGFKNWNFLFINKLARYRRSYKQCGFEKTHVNTNMAPFAVLNNQRQSWFWNVVDRKTEGSMPGKGEFKDKSASLFLSLPISLFAWQLNLQKVTKSMERLSTFSVR